jgi:ketosteroid isomerase-like protein
MEDEAAISEVIGASAAAVRRRDFEAPSRTIQTACLVRCPAAVPTGGLEAYRASWDLFSLWSSDPIPYELIEKSITAGQDLTFVVMTMRCAEPGPVGTQMGLIFA